MTINKNNAIYQQFNFQPSWPKAMQPNFCKKTLRIAKDIFSFIVFPVGLIRIASHYIIRPLILNFVILPALRRDSPNSEEQVFLENGTKGTRVRIPTADGKEISGIFILGNSSPEKLVIAVGGNGFIAESTGIFINDIVQDFSVLIVNPVGVDGGTGFPGTGGLDVEESFGLSVFNAYEFARQKWQFSHENILLYGFSLGGVQVTLGASHIEERYGDISIINDRSLRGTAQYAIAVAKRIKNYFNEGFSSKSPLLFKGMKCLAHIVPDSLISTIIRLFMHVFGLNVDAESAWLRLKSKNKCVIYAKKDRVIPYKEGAALYKGIKNKSDCVTINLGDSYDHLTRYCPKGNSDLQSDEVREQFNTFFDLKK